MRTSSANPRSFLISPTTTSALPIQKKTTKQNINNAASATSVMAFDAYPAGRQDPPQAWLEENELAQSRVVSSTGKKDSRGVVVYY